MPRTTRSTPTPPPPEDATAPIPAAPAMCLPNPNPDRASATLVDSATLLEDLPCLIPGALGAGMVLVFKSCAPWAWPGRSERWWGGCLGRGGVEAA